MSDSSEHLSNKQRRAILALVSGATQEAAAEQVRINPRTLYRWRQSKPFQDALRTARAEAFSEALGLLQTQANAAVSRLIQLQTDQEASPSVRLSACCQHIGFALRHYEIESILPRIEALEQQQERSA